MHPWKLHLLLLFLLFLFLVFDGLVRGRMRCIRSHLSCSHKEGSKYLTLSVIVIRRRSLPSSPPLDMMHHVLLVLVLSTCPCWLSLLWIHQLVDRGHHSSSARWPTTSLWQARCTLRRLTMTLHNCRRRWMVENHPQR